MGLKRTNIAKMKSLNTVVLLRVFEEDLLSKSLSSIKKEFEICISQLLSCFFL